LLYLILWAYAPQSFPVILESTGRMGKWASRP
jgi:hypothetical protein